MMPSEGVCHSFIPQQWRKSKCKLCFCDILEHRKNFSERESTRANMTLEGASAKIVNMNEEAKNGCGTGETIDLPSAKDGPDDIEPCYSPRSNYTTGSSKGSTDHLDDDDTVDTASTNFDSNDNMDESVRKGNNKGKDMLPSPYGYDQQFILDIEEGCNSPRTNKRRARSYNKRDSNLLQFSAMIRSSNSSPCSLTSEYTDGYSDYDYDVRSITDDTDDYTEVNDVIDELENIKPELSAIVQNERRMSRSKILDLERELEGQHDHYRAYEAVKERQVLAYQREIEGLKLELSSVKAHEHILALKSRLELEAKAARISDLELHVRSLEDEIQRLSRPLDDAIETQQYAFNKNLNIAEKRNMSLEEENRHLQEKLNLGEDLRRNDRELLEFLRKQLDSLENDLVAARESNRLLEDNLKLMEGTRVDLVKEQEKCAKSVKELESLRQKVKRRDRHIEDLEDDNVKLQKLKNQIESQLSKKEFQVKTMERRVSELQSKVTKCNKEIADLTGEKKTFEQVRKLTDLKLKDLQGSAEEGSEVENGKNIFIHTLEERLRYAESRVKELQLENNILIKDIGEVYNSLSNVEKECEEFKEKCGEMEIKGHKMEEERQHMEKKNQWLQRKLHKSEQEKKRALHRQNNAELKLVQYQEQCIAAADLSTANTDSAVSETDTRMLKLKLQSTEAKLSMIEGNKGYLETKVKSLERKVREKENEIQRLLDSLERDSGAPSQDYDRFDALERENVMLQSKLDEMALENLEQKQLVNQLEENNTHMEVTIKNLNEKLDTCNMRLRELENANHKLGREAFRRSQVFSPNQDELIMELQTHNKSLQEKVKKYSTLEELVEQLDNEVKKEKGNVQWYSNENEKLKIKLMKLTQNVQSVEKSKKEFEETIQNLQENNKELDSEVKRLEQKLEIYGELFGKDSKLSSSLRRRSYQSDEERDEERMIEKALAPLMEEIKEKDSQIRSLQEEMEERNVTINALNTEIDLLEANLAAMVTEKIKNMQFSGDSSCENEHSETETCTDNLFFTSGTTGKLSDSEEYNEDDTLTCVNVERKISSVDQAGNISPELHLESEKAQEKINDYTECITSDARDDSPDVSSVRDNSPDMVSDDQGLTVTTDVFYNILNNHRKTLEKKDLAYYQSVIDAGDDSPTESKFYKTIENALLEKYSDDSFPSPLPSLSDTCNNNTMTSERCSQNIEDGKIFIEDMYEKLDELEGMVNIKYKSPQGSPKRDQDRLSTGSINNDIHTNDNNTNFSSNTDKYSCTSGTEIVKKDNIDEIDSRNSTKPALIDRFKCRFSNEFIKKDDVIDSNEPRSPTKQGVKERFKFRFSNEFKKEDISDSACCMSSNKPGLKDRLKNRFSNGINKRDSYDLERNENGDDDLDRTISSSNSGDFTGKATETTEGQDNGNKATDNVGIDLSGLDDLLDEVNKRGSCQIEKPLQYNKKGVHERRSLPTSSSFRVRMPSLRTTKRRIVRLGELNRSESFDASLWKRGSYSGFNTKSHSSLEPDGANSASSTSSIASSSSQTSVIYQPYVDNDGGENSIDNGGGVDANNVPFPRPSMDANKLLNSSSQNIDNSNS